MNKIKMAYEHKINKRQSFSESIFYKHQLFLGRLCSCLREMTGLAFMKGGKQQRIMRIYQKIKHGF
jgi:hypothetical protein